MIKWTLLFIENKYLPGLLTSWAGLLHLTIYHNLEVETSEQWHHNQALQKNVRVIFGKIFLKSLWNKNTRKWKVSLLYNIITHGPKSSMSLEELQIPKICKMLSPSKIITSISTSSLISGGSYPDEVKKSINLIVSLQ